MNTFKLLMATLMFSALSLPSIASAEVNANLGAIPLQTTDTFSDFGYKKGIDSLVSTFVSKLGADERFKNNFGALSKPKLDALKIMLSDQFCEVLGGDCKYKGRNMKSAHQSMGVTRADFNALVEVLQVSMDEHNIPFSSQNKLLAKLAPMYRLIESH